MQVRRDRSTFGAFALPQEINWIITDEGTPVASVGELRSQGVDVDLV